MTLKFRCLQDEDQSSKTSTSISKLLTIVQSEYDWFGNLKVIDKLGSGSFGYVVRVNDNYGNRSAVKILLFRLSGGSDDFTGNIIIEDPWREYESMKDIYHRNLVNLFQYKEISLEVKKANQIFENVVDVLPIMQEVAVNGFIPLRVIEMELCGSTLLGWIQKVCKSAATPDYGMFQFKTIIGLLEGLRFLHERNIIHRDLAPRNIFFSKSKFCFFHIYSMINKVKLIPRKIKRNPVMFLRFSLICVLNLCESCGMKPASILF